jgi:hypothetical protein
MMDDHKNQSIEGRRKGKGDESWDGPVTFNGYENGLA